MYEWWRGLGGGRGGPFQPVPSGPQHRRKMMMTIIIIRLIIKIIKPNRTKHWSATLRRLRRMTGGSSVCTESRNHASWPAQSRLSVVSPHQYCTTGHVSMQLARSKRWKCVSIGLLGHQTQTQSNFNATHVTQLQML